MRQERDILERAVRAVSEQASKPDAVVDEALAAGLDGSLQVKADLEREHDGLVLGCSAYGRTVHWVPGLAATPGHWAHREPSPHGEPVV